MIAVGVDGRIVQIDGRSARVYSRSVGDDVISVEVIVELHYSTS